MSRGKLQGLLLPAALLLAMFSLVAATVVITLGRQSLQLTQFGERNNRQQLRAKAEVNRLLATLVDGAAVADFYDDARSIIEEGNVSWRSWVHPDPDNAGILHLHAEVWNTDSGPPGLRASRVVRVESAKKQVNFVQTSAGLSDFRLFYREDGETSWNPIPSTFTPVPNRTSYYESYDADDAGGLYVVEMDINVLDHADTRYHFRHFEPEAGIWTTLASPPGDGALASVSVQGGNIAALTRSGDDLDFDQVSLYDRASDSWTTLPDPPNRLYDDSGTLNTATERIKSMDIDVDNDGNIYFRGLVKFGPTAIRDYQTTIHKWDGSDWSTLPPPPPSLVPPNDFPTDRRLGYVNKKLAVTGDGQVAMTWETFVFGVRRDSNLLQFDGESWSAHPVPTAGTMYGSSYATNAGLDPNEETPFLTNLSSNLDGELYVSNTFNTVTLEENEFSLVDEPPASGDTQSIYGIAAGTKPTAGSDSYQSVLSF